MREDLNKRAPRVHGRAAPAARRDRELSRGQAEEVDVVNNPEDPAAGTRKVPFSRVLYIERDDFREDPPKKFFRLAPGREVRLRCAYFITCTGVVKDPATGEVTELRCTYDPATRGGDAPDGRKVRRRCTGSRRRTPCDAEVRLYDRLFNVEEPGKAGRLSRRPQPGVARSRDATPRSSRRRPRAAPGTRFQFERLGYFCVDPDTRPARRSSTAPSR